jgi:hypothetical protein
MPAFQKLGANIYALTGLRPDEFLDARVAKTFEPSAKGSQSR